MPIAALSNPSTLEQLQAIGVLPMGGGISSPLPQPMAQPQQPLVPPQAPSQPAVSPDGSFVPPQAKPTPTQAAGPGPVSTVGRAILPAAFPPAPVPQPAPPPPDIASTAQTLQAAQAADGQPGPPPQPDLYSGATVPSAQAQGQPATIPAAGAPPQAAPGAPPGPATGDAQLNPQDRVQSTGMSPAIRDENPAQRYNRLYQSVIGAESGGADNAKNPLSSASGRGQITDGTYQTWLATPAGKASGFTMADKNTPAAQNAAGPGIMASNDQQFQAVTRRSATDAELKASWLLGGNGAAQLAAHPDAPITAYLSPDAIKNNGSILRPDMTGAQALQSASRYYDLAGGVQVAGPGAPTGSAQGRLAQAQQASGGQSVDAQGSSIGINADEIAGIAQKLGYKPSSSMIGPGDTLLSMGLGMMGGRTWADSMKNAGQAFQGMRGQQLEAQGRDNSNALGIANAGVSMANTAAQRRLQMAQFALEGKRLDNQMNYQNASLGIRQQSADNTSKKTDAMLDPVKKAELALAGVAPKQNLKDSAEIDAAGESAADRITQFNNLQQVARDPTTAAGAGALNSIKREIALATGLNITADTTGVQMGQMLSRMGQSEAAGAMKGLGLRTQREFDVWKEQAATLGTNPDAAAAVMQPMLNKASADYQAFKKWHDPATNQAAILATPNGVANFRATFDQQAAETNMAGGSTVTHSPTGGTPKAGAVLRYDASGNIIQ